MQTSLELGRWVGAECGSSGSHHPTGYSALSTQHSPPLNGKLFPPILQRRTATATRYGRQCHWSRFAMTASSDLVELSCRLRVPATSVYAHLLRYLKEHPYHTISDFLLDAATAFYLPLSLMEPALVPTIAPEDLHRYGCQAVSTLTAQSALLTSRLNAQLPSSLQMHMSLAARTHALPHSIAAGEDTVQSAPLPEKLLNPFSHANFSNLK